MITFQRFFFLLFLLGMAPILHAQQPLAHHWSMMATASQNTKTLATAVDANGNVFNTGYFEGTADFNPGSTPMSLTAVGGDLFIQKIAPDGQVLWVKQIGAVASTVYPKAMTTDNSGNIYITGYYQTISNIDFNPGAAVFNLSTNGGVDMFVLKLTNNGDFTWVYRGAASTNGYVVEPNSMMIDPATQVIFVGGKLRGDADFNVAAVGGEVFNAGTLNDGFVLKVQPTGDYLQVGQIGGTSEDAIVDITMGNGGTVWALANVQGTPDIDPSTTTNTFTCAGTQDMVVLQLNANTLSLVWNGGVGGSSAYVIPADIVLDPSGNILVSGSWSGATSINAAPAGSPQFITAPANGQNASFISRIDAGLVFTNWIAQIQTDQPSTGLGDCRIQSMSVTPVGDIVVACAYRGAIDIDVDFSGVLVYNSVSSFDEHFVARYNGVTGALEDHYNFGGATLTNNLTDARVVLTGDGMLVSGNFPPGSLDVYSPNLGVYVMNNLTSSYSYYLTKLAPSAFNPDPQALYLLANSIQNDLGQNFLRDPNTMGTAVWDTLLNPNLANWYGIATNAQGRVTDIFLDNIEGDIPGVVLNTTNTSRPLPSGLFEGARLEFLRTINLSSCRFNEPPNGKWFISIGANATQNTVLETVNISGNNFGQFVAPNALFPKVVGGFASLQNLIARGCMEQPFDISTVIPDPLSPGFDTIHTRRLQIEENLFTGEFPSMNGHFPNMEELYAAANSLSNVAPFLSMPSLQRIDLSYNAFLDADIFTMILNNGPNLIVFAADSCMAASATNRTLDFSQLSSINGGFEIVYISHNGLNHPASGALPLDVFLQNSPDIILHFEGNNFDSVVISPTNAYQVQELDLSNNRFNQVLPAAFFNNLDSLQILNLHNNGFYGEFPAPTNGQFYPFKKLREFRLDSNHLRGTLPLDWISSWAGVLDLSPLEVFSISNNHFSAVQPFVPLNTELYYFLNTVNCASNQFDFNDLAGLVRSFQMQGSISLFSTDWIYAPNSGRVEFTPGIFVPDPNSFVYAPQDTIGIGGTRHKEPGSSFFIDEGLSLSNIGTTEAVWLRNDTIATTELVAYGKMLHGVGAFGAFDVSGVVLNLPPLANPQLGTDVASANDFSGSVTAAHDFTSTAALNIYNANAVYGTHNDVWRYNTQVYNDSFPNLVIVSRPKRVIVDYCYDTMGVQIQCQQMFVQFPGNYSALKSQQPLSETQKQAVRDSVGATVTKSCPCGDLEMWEISDTTYEGYLLSNGKGTRNVATTTHGKPNLLSANSNYRMSTVATSKQEPDNLPTGNGNTAAVKVAMVDSGVDFDHPALTNHILEPGAHTNDSCALNLFGYNFMDTTTLPFDDHGHGTHVAGVLAGVAYTTNTMQVGTNDKIAIMPFKYTNAAGEGTLFDATCAMYMAIENNAKVINASWGYRGDECPALEDVLRYAEAREVMVVCAAGNEGTDNAGANTKHWPSLFASNWPGFGLTNLVSVASLDTTDADLLAPYSNYSNQAVHLATEGKAWTTEIDTAGNVFEYSMDEGTSFATPKVARAIALLWSQHPTATPCEIKEALRLGLDTLQSADADKLLWRGRLNFEKALAILDSTSSFDACITGTTEPDFSGNADLQFFPNPFGNSIQIQWLNAQNASADIRIYSVDGRLHHQQTSNATYEMISTTDWPVGVYVVQVRLGHTIYTEKIVKQ